MSANKGLVRDQIREPSPYFIGAEARDIIMMDPRTRSFEQANRLLDDILSKPCNHVMKEYFSK